MRYIIVTPFHDGGTVQNSEINYIRVEAGWLSVISLNYNWSFLEITSNDYEEYPEENVTYLDVLSGSFKMIEEKDEPIWEALEGNMVEYSEDDLAIRAKAKAYSDGEITDRLVVDTSNVFRLPGDYVPGLSEDLFGDEDD